MESDSEYDFWTQVVECTEEKKAKDLIIEQYIELLVRHSVRHCVRHCVTPDVDKGIDRDIDMYQRADKNRTKEK